MPYLIYILSFSLIVCCIELDISVPSFPDMVKHFGVCEGTIGLTVAYNFLGFCISGFLYGPLSESYGRRNVMIFGNGLLMLGAISCFLAPNIEILLISRLIQGVGASTSAVVVFAIMADIYKGNEYVKSVAFMNSLLTIAMAGAPIAGAFINEMIGWRGNYGVVACFASLSWLALYLILPETKKQFDNFDITKIMANYKLLFTNGEFMAACLVPSVLCATYLSFVVCGSFFYVSTLGLSVVEYGFHQGAILISFAVMSLYAGKFAEKYGRVWSVKFTSLVYFIGLLGLLIVSLFYADQPYLVTAMMIIIGLCEAVIYPVIFAYSMEIFPKISGTASSAIMGMRALLCAFFTGYATHIFGGVLFNIVKLQFMLGILSLILTLYVLKTMKD